jgi:hypothetical protein
MGGGWRGVVKAIILRTALQRPLKRPLGGGHFKDQERLGACAPIPSFRRDEGPLDFWDDITAYPIYGGLL